MITIFQLKNLAEELNLVTRDQFFYKISQGDGSSVLGEEGRKEAPL